MIQQMISSFNIWTSTPSNMTNGVVCILVLWAVIVSMALTVKMSKDK